MVSMSMLGKNSKQVIVLWNQRTNEMTLALGMLRTRMQKVPSGDPDNDFQKKKKKKWSSMFLQRAVRTSLEKQLDPLGPASRGGSVQELIRNPIATRGFPGGVQTPCFAPWIRPCVYIGDIGPTTPVQMIILG